MGKLTNSLLVVMLMPTPVIAKSINTSFSKEKKVIVAIIDTGISPDLYSKDFICKNGNHDFTGVGLKDNHGHGTHISGIIDQYAKDMVMSEKAISAEKLDSTHIDYCQMILKFFDPHAGNNPLLGEVLAIQWAISHHVDIINLSEGGTESSEEEKKWIIKALDAGIKVVAAAGNEHSNSDKVKFYPAMYDKRIYVVGNLQKNLKRLPSSDYGSLVNTWEIGENVWSRLPDGNFGYMTGTSQAAAIKTGKLVREMLTH